MSKYLILWLGLCCIACNQVERKPKLVMHQANVDLGEIDFDSTHTIEFSFSNQGNQLLVIDTASASCDCTTPQLSKKLLKTGDTAKLIVKYKPVDTGYFDKKVVIKSNTDSSFSIVSFKGRAVK